MRALSVRSMAGVVMRLYQFHDLFWLRLLTLTLCGTLFMALSPLNGPVTSHSKAINSPVVHASSALLETFTIFRVQRIKYLRFYSIFGVRYTGDVREHARTSVFAWEAAERGQEVHPVADPSQAEMLRKVHDEKKTTLKEVSSCCSIRKLTLRLRTLVNLSHGSTVVYSGTRY